jgi:hypothetical protein
MLAPLPPSIRAGWAGEVASWVLPCPPSLPTRGGGGVGDKGQPLHMTTYLKSQAQRSLNFTSLMTTTFPISGNGLSTHPLVFPLLAFSLLVFPLHPDDPVTLLPLELGMVGSAVENSAPRLVLYPDHSREPAVVPVGTRTGDSWIRVSLSNLGGPIKSSRVGESHK